MMKTRFIFVSRQEEKDFRQGRCGVIKRIDTLSEEAEAQKVLRRTAGEEAAVVYEACSTEETLFPAEEPEHDHVQVLRKIVEGPGSNLALDDYDDAKTLINLFHAALKEEEDNDTE